MALAETIGARIAGVAVWLLLASRASGQSWQDFHLDSWSGHLRFEAEYVDERRTNFASLLEERELSLREELLLRARGSYYHPKFLEYDLKLELGLEQRDVETTGNLQSRSVDSNNVSFDLSALLFRDLPYTLDVYGHRTETRTRQTFFNTTEAVVFETGANLRAKNWWIPSRLHVSHYDYEGRGLDTFTETRDKVRLSGSKVSNGDHYQYGIELNSVDLGDKVPSFRDLNFTSSTAHHLGENKLDRWMNSVRFRRQTGGLDSETSGVTSSFHKQWTKTLGADHDLRYSRTSLAGSSTDMIGVSSRLTHRLFQSLTTNGTARLSRTTFGDGEVNTYGGVAQVNYSKRIPHGRFDARYMADYYDQDETGGGGVAAVIDEAHTFIPGDLILLSRPAVDLLSIVVTDGTGLIIYTEGPDYVVSPQGAFVRLDIPPGSLISPGQSILVDYDYFPNPDLRFRNLSQTAGLNVSISKMAEIGMSRSTVSQDLLSGFDTGVLDDSTRTRADLRVHPFGMTLSAEYENLDSRIAPFERVRYVAAYQRAVAARTVWRMSADTFRTRFKGDPGRERGTAARTSIFMGLSRNLTADMRAEWNEIDYRTDAGTGLLFEAGLDWRVRALDLSIRGRFSDEDFEVASDQRIATLLLSITRRF